MMKSYSKARQIPEASESFARKDDWFTKPSASPVSEYTSKLIDELKSALSSVGSGEKEFVLKLLATYSEIISAKPNKELSRELRSIFDMIKGDDVLRFGFIQFFEKLKQAKPANDDESEKLSRSITNAAPFYAALKFQSDYNLFSKQKKEPSVFSYILISNDSGQFPRNDGGISKYGKYSPANDCGAYAARHYQQFFENAGISVGSPWRNEKSIWAQAESYSLVGNREEKLKELKEKLRPGDIIQVLSKSGNVYFQTPDAPAFNIRSHVGGYGGDGFAYDWPGCRQIPLDSFITPDVQTVLIWRIGE